MPATMCIVNLLTHFVYSPYLVSNKYRQSKENVDTGYDQEQQSCLVILNKIKIHAG